MEKKEIINYRIYWLDGTTTDIKGLTIADACHKAGISPGALPAMDYFEEIKSKNHENRNTR